MQKIKRIFLITADALRADVVDPIVNKGLTPNIKKFAENAVVFTHAFANGVPTVQAFTCIFTSTYPLMHTTLKISPFFKRLPELLQKHEFYTVAFHSTPYLSSFFGWEKGFDEFHDFLKELKEISTQARFLFRSASWKDRLKRTLGKKLAKFSLFRTLIKIRYKRRKSILPYLDGQELLRYVTKWIQENINKRFFMWIHFMDTHEPYAPPKPWLPEEFKDRNEARIFNHVLRNKEEAKKYVNLLKRLYEGEVRYLDFLLGNFFEFLEEKNLLEESLVIFTSDHGDAFLEHGMLQHDSHNLYNEVIHVPLIIYDGENSGIYDIPISHIDIAPTIIDYLGLKKCHHFYGYPWRFLYQNKHYKTIYVDGIEIDFDHWVYLPKKAHIAVIDYPWKLIYHYDGRIELYNLNKDPKETVDLCEKDADLVKKLLAKVKRHITDCALMRRLRIKGLKTQK